MPRSGMPDRPRSVRSKPSSLLRTRHPTRLTHTPDPPGPHYQQPAARRAYRIGLQTHESRSDVPLSSNATARGAFDLTARGEPRRSLFNASSPSPSVPACKRQSRGQRVSHRRRASRPTIEASAVAPDELRRSARHLDRPLHPCRSGHVAVCWPAAPPGVRGRACSLSRVAASSPHRSHARRGDRRR